MKHNYPDEDRQTVYACERMVFDPVAGLKWMTFPEARILASELVRRYHPNVRRVSVLHAPRNGRKGTGRMLRGYATITFGTTCFPEYAVVHEVAHVTIGCGEDEDFWSAGLDFLTGAHGQAFRRSLIRVWSDHDPIQAERLRKAYRFHGLRH